MSILLEFKIAPQKFSAKIKIDKIGTRAILSEPETAKPKKLKPETSHIVGIGTGSVKRV
jgi:hypothetical protein